MHRARLALCLFLFKIKMAKFLFRIYIFSLKAEDRDRGDRGELFHLLVHYQNAYNSQGWTRRKPGA